MFQFKQFKVIQETNAMKVCTDSCILGAWAAVENAKKILDIGCGTALLSLMAAQRTSAQIVAVEIDEASALEAQYNVNNSPFKEQIEVIVADIKNLNTGSYDTILCNPPFFEDSLKSKNEDKNRAKHTVDLSLNQLAKVIENLLITDGKAFILLPPNSAKVFRKEMESFNLFEKGTLLIYNQLNKPVFREILVIGKQLYSTKDLHTLSIRNTENQQYSDQFTELLKDYYLIF